MSFYVKAKITDEVEIKMKLYDDEIYTSCPDCGKEMQVDADTIVSILGNGGDFAGTSIYCVDCSKKKGFRIIKGGQT